MEDLVLMIREAGILPFFANAVKGWSVEEHIDPAVWFTDRDGPWDWRGRLASGRVCVYGKLIRGRAAFVSPEWFADLANWRRNGYDWEGWAADGNAQYNDILLVRYMESHPGVLARQAKRECGFSRGYDTVLTRLQMQTFVVLSDFRYSVSKQGIPYGWGNAVIDLADRWLEEDALFVPEDRQPTDSFERMITHLKEVLPRAEEAVLRKELK